MSINLWTIDPFDLQFDRHLFLPAATATGRFKSRDLFYPIIYSCCLQKQMNIELQVERFYKWILSSFQTWYLKDMSINRWTMGWSAHLSAISESRNIVLFVAARPGITEVWITGREWNLFRRCQLIRSFESLIILCIIWGQLRACRIHLERTYCRNVLVVSGDPLIGDTTLSSIRHSSKALSSTEYLSNGTFVKFV